MHLASGPAILLLLLVAVLLAWVRQPALAASPSIFPLSQVRPGLKGYGLTVFAGTKPERFEVEVIAVLERSLPGQDLILTRLSGHGLERTGVIAGMSGSPVYLNGRLAGAVSYGWAFSKDPIAGVTPIEAMLEERDRPAPDNATVQSGGLERLATPLLVSGLGPAALARLRRRLGPLGFTPVAGAAGRSTTAPGDPVEPEAGGAVGVPLIRGDWNAVAVGTITYADRERVLAFGHPLYQLGRLRVPATGAVVHTVLASVEFSFKFASSLGAMGALVEDRQSCIVVDRGAAAPMVPVDLRVRNAATGRQQSFSLEVARHPRLTPMLLVEALAGALDAAEAAGDELTARVHLEARFGGGRTLELEDTFDCGTGGPFDAEAFLPCLTLPANAFDQAPLESSRIRMDLVPGRGTAEILGAFPARRQVLPGAEFPLQVVVKPYGQPPVTMTVPVTAPPGRDGRRLSLYVDAGSLVAPDDAPAETVEGLIRREQARARTTDLVVSVPLTGDSLRHRGRHVPHVPASVRAVFGGRRGSEELRRRSSTRWVLSGAAQTEVELRPVAVTR